MNFEKYIEKIILKHPEFEKYEIEILCEEYIQKFNRKTKESTKEKSVRKYLEKEFEMNFDEEEQSFGEKIEASNSLSRIPKHYFQSGTKLDKNDHVVKIQNLNKQIGKTIIFDNANLNIKANEKLALVGKNGAGKSTLLKILIGKEQSDSGILELSKSVKIGFLSQDIFWENPDRTLEEEMLTCFPQITKTMNRISQIEKILKNNPENVVDITQEYNNLLQRMSDTNSYQKYSNQLEILKYFGFGKEHFDLKISQLSRGEQTKVQIAKFLLQEVNFLVLDEPTNHLDINGILFLEYFCTLRDKNLICISHDKKFLNNVFDKVVEISDKKLFKYNGNYDEYKEQKQKRYELDLKKYEEQQKYLKQQEEFIERFRYKSSKASQVQSRIKLLEKMEKFDKPEKDISEKNILFTITERLPNLIAEFSDLVIGYDLENYLVKIDNNVRIDKDMKIGIIGKNGTGKSTLLKTILGELKPLGGNIKINEKLRIGSYSQTIQDLDRNKTIVDEIVGPEISNQQARTLLGSLLISNEKMSQQIKTLSGGEKAKVALTKMLLTRPHVIVMDEPTNHLDIDSKEVIKKLLDDFNGVSIIVSHDRDFLEQTSNLLRVLVDKNISIYQNIEKGFSIFEKTCDEF